MNEMDPEGLRQMMKLHVSGSYSSASVIAVTTLTFIAMILIARLIGIYLNLNDLKDDEDLEPW